MLGNGGVNPRLNPYIDFANIDPLGDKKVGDSARQLSYFCCDGRIARINNQLSRTHVGDTRVFSQWRRERRLEEPLIAEQPHGLRVIAR